MEIRPVDPACSRLGRGAEAISSAVLVIGQLEVR